MDKFLELSFMNHIRNNEDLITPYEMAYKPLVEFVRERLSAKACDDFEDLLAECSNSAMHYAGVLGMELAIGVTNGTIKQKIEA